MFSEKCFRHFTVFGGTKIMVNENYFRKSSSEFKLFILSRTFVGICHRRTLEFVSCPSLLSKIPNFSIWLLESGSTRQIPTITSAARFRHQNPVGDRIWRHPAVVAGFWPNLLDSGQNKRTTGIRPNWPDSYCFGWDLARERLESYRLANQAKLDGSRQYWPDSGNNSWNLAC